MKDGMGMVWDYFRALLCFTLWIYDNQGPFLLTWMNFNPYMTNYTHHNVWEAITYPLPNFCGATTSNFISTFYGTHGYLFVLRLNLVA